MRQIKFRGKRISGGGWVYGYYLHDEKSTVMPHAIYSGSFHNVIPESVGQFTGLHDKNGKEIYEGDIVSISESGIRNMADPNPYMRIIKWSEEEGRLTTI